MAEYVQKKIEDFRPVLEQLKQLELFTEQEVRDTIKNIKKYEYKLQRHTKSKEDYLSYIKFEMDLLKLVKQRREKYGITQKKSDIDFAIANKINHLYKEAISKFQDDLRFWIAYMAFCKHVKFHNCVSRMIGRMLSVHQNKPKCWHVASRWEIEESNNPQNAKNFLLRGIHFHPTSQLLYTDIFKLELDDYQAKIKKSESDKDDAVSNASDDSDMPVELKKVFVTYEQAFKMIKDIKFIIELLNIAQEYEKTEKLQNRIVSDMVKEYPHEPLMWDTMARRELKGLVQPSLNNEDSMELDTQEPTSLRDRITNCNEVYQTAVKKIKSEEMWSLFIDCMLEINQDLDSLPNYKRKLLKNALYQGHQAKRLKEKYYLNWIDMLNINQVGQDSNSSGQSKLYEVLCWATEALPQNESLWHAKLQYLLSSNNEDLVTETFNKAVSILKENSLSLWRLKLLHTQAKNPENLEKFFQDALKSEPNICNYMKPFYIEWLVLTKDINAARKVYDKLCLQPPLCLELHKKMAALELLQPEISLQNARKPNEKATLEFGKKNTDVWMDYIVFEMKHGDPLKVSTIYNRAVHTLDWSIVKNFESEYAFKKANPETHKIFM